MRIFVRVRDEGLRRRVGETAERLGAELVDASTMDAEALATALEGERDLVLVQADVADGLDRLRSDADRAGAAFVVACPMTPDGPVDAIARADDWVRIDAEPRELMLRIRTAAARARARASWKRTTDAADLIRYEKLLYNERTRAPTLPLVIDKARDLLQARDELAIFYVHFAWYPKVEEIFGLQKLDEVLRTTAEAVREFFRREEPDDEDAMLLAFGGADDFVVFSPTVPPPERMERRVRGMTQRLQRFIGERITAAHGDEIATLAGIFVGAATAAVNPRVRPERVLYRGLRTATSAARSAEEWERAHKITDLKAALREGAVFMEYQPIVVTATEEVFGYEALARGVRQELRSPEVLFDVAEEANLVWELSRLLRRRAVEGIIHQLEPDQLLFMNVDPHDFNDPRFREMDAGALGIDDASRIVLEITERTAIHDYPRFQTYLAAFREHGFRFAVDDAGSGYAGLGSIANLEPDFIKLDISLISEIDSNFLKQNLVQTLVTFAEEHDARVIAEAVETREEFETVRRIGVHLAQGFYFDQTRFAEFPKAS